VILAPLAISTGRAILIGVAAGLAVIVLAATVLAALRRPRRAGPDIPAGMQPGPSDADLEKPVLERMMTWGALSVLFMAIWVPVVWLQEPNTNRDDDRRMLEESVERGRRATELFSEENPGGVGCVGCHGEELTGGVTVWEGDPSYPVPDLTTVCQRLTLQEVVETIARGRPGTPMPSWSVQFAGSLMDQQINDIVNYILTIQKVPREQNQCLEPPEDTTAT
jgi:mono/diheme cytochrome c family protein